MILSSTLKHYTSPLTLMSHRTELHHQHFSSSPVCFLQSDYKSWSWIIWKQLQTDPGYFMVNVLVCVSVMMKCTCNLAQGGLLWVFSHYVTVCVCVFQLSEWAETQTCPSTFFLPSITSFHPFAPSRLPLSPPPPTPPASRPWLLCVSGHYQRHHSSGWRVSTRKQARSS